MILCFQDWLFNLQGPVQSENERSFCGEIISNVRMMSRASKPSMGPPERRPSVASAGYSTVNWPYLWFHFIEPLGKLTEVKMDYNGQERRQL